MHKKMCWCGFVISILLIIFSLVVTPASKWIIFVIGVLMFLKIISKKGCCCNGDSCCTTEKPKAKKKGKKK